LLTLSLKFFLHPDLIEFRKTQLEPCFARVVTEKPKASRSESSEAYWVCLGYKGRQPES
jgi:23S rRNA (uridine2552-2'-O)-methyltransferase